MADHALLLSVRANATRTVAPDFVVLTGVVSTTAEDKVAALAEAARALSSLTEALAALGGTARTAMTGRPDLTWSAQSTTTDDEQHDDPRTGRWVHTGRINANVRVEIVARDFALLPRIESALGAHAEFLSQGTEWRVDEDNPAWPQVRADAIRAAVVKARDYAAALGGTLSTVEHIADTGLLDGASSSVERTASRASARALNFDYSGTPSLDPVPCELTAVIDARFRAEGISIA